MKKSYSPGSAFVISMSSPKTVNISAMVLSVRFTVAVKCACSLPDWISLIRLIYRDFLSGLPPILPDKRDIYAPSVDVLEPIPLPMDPKADLTPCKPCLARHKLNATVSAFSAACAFLTTSRYVMPSSFRTVLGRLWFLTIELFYINGSAIAT